MISLQRSWLSHLPNVVVEINLQETLSSSLGLEVRGQKPIGVELRSRRRNDRGARGKGKRRWRTNEAVKTEETWKNRNAALSDKHSGHHSFRWENLWIGWKRRGNGNVHGETCMSCFFRVSFIFSRPCLETITSASSTEEQAQVFLLFSFILSLSLSLS